MSTAIEKVSGIGPQTAALLASHGIHSAEDLAARRSGDLAAIKGFNTTRSEQVIAAARLLTGAADKETPVKPGKSSQKDKSKKVVKKKKKSKKKNNDQKKKSPQEDKKKSAKTKKNKGKKK